MKSGFSGDMFYSSGTTTGTGPGSGSDPGLGRAASLTTLSSFQQQQQQHRLPLQQGMLSSMNQIAQRRAADLLIGKRSFGDYQQTYQQQQQLLLQQQQQQQNSLLLLQQKQQGLAYFQQQQQQQQQSYLMRSVKQRTLPSSPIFPNNNNNNVSNSISSPSTRFGVPIYGQLRQHNYQQQLFNYNNNNIINGNNNINNQFNSTNNCLISNLSSTTNNNPIQPQNPAFSTTLGYSNFGPNLVQPKAEPQPDNNIFGYSNLAQPKPEPQPDNSNKFGYQNHPVSMVPPKVEPDLEDHKILSTLHELEKQLLDDDDSNNHDENDAVSVITNSEWSETFQNLMSPNPGPGPNTNHACSSTSGSSNTNTIPTSNNNNMISPSPTSSTSSCCSTSAPHQQLPPPPPPPPPPQPETLSVKELVSSAANAISEGKPETADEFLTRLARISDPKGNSDQRLGFYLGNALNSRTFPSKNPAPILELYSEDQMQSMYTLYDISPCFKFGLLAANLVMLEAITTALQEGIKVHVIDFDVGQGAQYTNLLRALAERRNQQVGGTNGIACELKITVVESELENRRVIDSVKDGLIKLAEKVGIKLKFEGLTRKITELTRESLGCEEGEAIVVNFAFKLHRVPDESVSMDNLRDELLRRVKELNPRAVTLVEQEMNGNTAPFMTRVNESCGYYGALFDSLEATLPREHLDRVRVEEGLGRKMANAVACEGRERIERAEVFGKWRARMSMAGFDLKPLISSVAESMRAKLNSARGGNPGFTVKEESGGVGFGWMGRTLTVASAWR